MGLFDMLKGFHESGEGPNNRDLDDYGTPAYSLYTARELSDMHFRIDVTNEQGEVLYYTKSNLIAIKGKTDIIDADDNLVAHLEKRPISIHETRFITMADGRSFTLSNELFHVIKDVTNIEGLDWQIRGNVLGLHFALLDGNEEPVAVIGQKMISLHEKFSVDIYQPALTIDFITLMN